jgi:pyruvate/2-oxoglutarate dehydrogenase complex dihydrolipoamide acyltransferase (E2) component
MAQTIIMPQLGETVAEGKILTWFKSVGDEIKVGDRLFEVETDKVTVEVEAVSAGKLSDVRVGNGESAKVGAVVAVLDGDQAAAAPAPAAQATASPAPASRAMAPFEEVKTPAERYGPAQGPDGLRVTPLARRLIAQNGLDAGAIARAVSARGGKRISADDVEAALREPSIAPLAGAVTLSGIRQKTADRLAENWRTIPHVFQAIEADFTNVEAARAKHKQRWRDDHGLALTYLPFIARATCIALRDFPNINARFDGSTLTPSRDVHLGIAVDLDHKGLVVPVVRSAGDYTLTGLTRAIARQVDAARAGKLSADDMAGGTYSISNNGAFGTLFTAPIINAPQVAILSTDAIRKRAAVVETPQGDFIAPRLIGMLGQSFDHRAFDGAYAAAFLSRLKTIIEHRNWFEELES